MTNIRPMFGRFFGASVMWSFMEFARFSFDLLAMVRGIKDNRVSSFYGMGSPEHVDAMEKQAKET